MNKLKKIIYLNFKKCFKNFRLEYIKTKNNFTFYLIKAKNLLTPLSND